jgi:glycosyltransferase involved in cell wall biosynthesis
MFKRKYGIDQNERIVLYLGRIHKTKGIDLLIKAFAFLLNEFRVRDVVLVIAGPDDGYFETASRLVNSLELEDNVLFTGFISRIDKMASLVDADIFVTPAFLGFPITFLESCATGTPILTTSMQDYLDWIDGQVGYVTKPEVRDLASAMCKVLSDKTLKETLSKTCLQFVKDRFSSSKVAERLEQIYESVIKR